VLAADDNAVDPSMCQTCPTQMSTGTLVLGLLEESNSIQGLPGPAYLLRYCWRAEMATELMLISKGDVLT